MWKRFLPLMLALCVLTSAKIAVVRFHSGDVYSIPLQAFEKKIKQLVPDAEIVGVWNFESKYENGEKILKEVRAAHPDLIFALGTGTVEYLAGKHGNKNPISDIPVVFAAVTHPVNSGVVKSWEKPGTNFTGAALFVDPYLLFKILSKEGFTKWAVPIATDNSGNTQTTVNACKKAQEKLGLEINFFRYDVSDKKKLEKAVKADAERIAENQALLVSYGYAGLKMMKFWKKLQAEKHIPLVTVFTFKKNDVVIAYGVDMTENGERAAEIAAKILKGEASPETTPVWKPERGELIINLKLAKEIGVSIPPSLLKIAKEVIK